MTRLVLTTFADPEVAARVIRTLVEARLAACGTIHPGARSIYHWNGAIEDTAEVTVTLKTTVELYPALEARLTELHPYETPEIVAIDPAAVSGPYAKWVAESCRS